jgi:hypothetical protein
MTIADNVDDAIRTLLVVEDTRVTLVLFHWKTQRVGDLWRTSANPNSSSHCI